MSHLSLDARAILHYLNDLGYRNITAEQLKEFLKGMQPKPDKSGISSKYRTTNTTETTATTTTPAETVQQQQRRQKDIVPTTATNLSSPNDIKSVKIIKSKRPLCHFKFYLDICDHQLTKRIEDQIKALGGNLEFFLTENVTHFITDKTVTSSLSNNSRPNTPQTPATPNTPLTPYTGLESTNDARFTRGGATTPLGASGLKTRQSRADAILNRARLQSNNTVVGTAAATTPTPLTNLRTAAGTTAHATLTDTKPVVQQPSYKIWQTEKALSFFKKISTELRDYLEIGISDSRGSGKGNVINLKGNYIKIEALKRNTRPYYHIIKKPDDWPKIDLTCDDGAFRLQIKDKPSIITAEAAAQQQVMTRKSRMRSSQQLQQQLTISNEKQSQKALKTTGTNTLPQLNSNKNKATTTNTGEVEESTDKQCGVCEICKIEYDTLTIHLKTKDHEFFVKNPNNFTALDKLIQSTADLNKFLNEDTHVVSDNSADIPEGLVEVEEMELDESVSKVEENLNDPLDDSTPSTSIFSTTRPNSAESLKRRPSPALREKSKRITKGQHSSEKFQSKTTQSLANKSVSPPQKKHNVSNMVELQRADSAATAVNAITPATTRRKAAATSAATLSPPIRAMLPPSSLYKVVETAETCVTPVRSRRNANGVDIIEETASPSLIVKFQKVRLNEVQRLNGEAENFMFPRTRTSSELHTDTDRQTTSERARASMSSTSIDSTSEMDLTGSTQDSNTSARSNCGRKIAIGIRRRGGRVGAGNTATNVEPQRKLSVGSNSSDCRQRFRSTPIQPRKQLISRSATKTTTNTTTEKSSIALPEATRKSSRTATAIVSKATTSSRLVRAQVEAAKQTNRQKQSAKVRASIAKPMNTIALPESLSRTTTAKSNKRSGALVVKMEDRMGERVAIQRKPYVESVNDSNSENEDVDEEDDDKDDDKDDDDEDDDEEDEVDEEGVEDDDVEKDKDYVASNAGKKRTHAETIKLSMPLFASRDARAARREARLNFFNKLEHIKQEILEEENLSPPTKAAKKLATPQSIKVKEKVPPPKSKQTKNGCTLKGKAQLLQPAPHIFDFTKSECLSNMTYAFECLPTADLWHQVFTRQDAGEERYHTYFGQTKYRKLPYELGPIPFNTTLKTNNWCKICNKTVTATAVTAENVQSKVNIKQEILNECEEQAHQSSSGVVTAATKDQHEETKGSALYKHKKLHLLQRYQQEQALQAEQQHVGNVENEQKVALVTPNPVTTEIAPLGISHLVNTAISKCDSKASTPELFDREFVPLGELTTAELIRASSTHSNTSSSYASSTASHSKKAFRNKHLNRIAELPPRKSPREHASTLALVSCIIRQRQDSLSKNNSEVDEPPTTPTLTFGTNLLSKYADDSSNLNSTSANATNKLADIEEELPTTLIKQSSPTPLEKQKQVASPRTTRSAAATPIEELRFTTEISENVKRMRRGQNKYDHSPPFVHNTTRRGRRATQMPLASTNSPTLSRRLVIAAKQDIPTSVVLGKRKRRDRLNALSLASKHRATYKSANLATNTTANGLNTSLTGVRKLGTKKGVLEFEFNNLAMKRLDAATQHSNPDFEEWVIDRYLELAGKEYDIEATQFDVAIDDNETESENVTSVREDSVGNAVGGVNTPPPTDCFTSDFDLYDMLTGIQPGNANAGTGCGDEEETNNRRNSFCFYSSTSLQRYYRKRKSMKSNRTGWPKAQKRKASTRQQRMLDEKISFEKIGIFGKDLIQIKEEPLVMCDDKVEEEAEGDEEHDQFNQDAQAINTVQTKKVANGGGAELEDDRGGGDNGGGDGVITPPATDEDDEGRNNVVGDNDTERGADCVASCGDDESLFEDDETIAESIEIDEDDEEDDNTPEADIDATDADVEEEVYDDDVLEDEEEEQIEDVDDDVDLQNVEENDEFEDAYDHDANDVDIFADAQAAVNQLNPRKSASDMNSSNEKSARLSPNISGSSHEEQNKVLISLLNAKPSNMSTSLLATSTPTTQSSRQQQHNRRTPQLNGSLGSCISPNEKLGDHSDIFTVSSDGLDTDLDLSNPHGQMKADDDHRMDTHQCPHQTPKRKFDISKYAPGSAKASSCAAEAATAAAKSLAISQFLKKEVRVTCRRLRAPFRRFRYRR